MKSLFLLFFLILLPGCLINKQQETPENKIPVELYDLNESTDIILSLLKKDELTTILAESNQDKEQIDILIKNFSPSEMAFEAEVLSHENPVVVLFFDPIDNNTEIIKKLTELAKRYQDSLKFIKINREKLFKITEKSEVDIFPTIMIIHNRNEVSRIEKPILTTLEDKIQKIITPQIFKVL